MDNFKKQENTTIRSWYLNWTHEQIIVDKHQRKCKNSCEKFQALKSIGSQHKLGLENIEETSYTLLPLIYNAAIRNTTQPLKHLRKNTYM